MSYKAIGWNRQKRIYDRTILILIGSYLIMFALLAIVLRPGITVETLIVRAFGTLAFVLLHIILIIGPLTRLNSKFLPLLYNRRHLGVTMFLAAATHGIFGIIQFHTLGNVNPLVSLFTSNMDFGSLVHFPFQVLGFFGLLILFLMASTSHDFWLANLGARTWKALHMLVYVAYGLILMHVFLGAFQQEFHPLVITTTFLGFLTVSGFHLAAGFKQREKDRKDPTSNDDWVKVARPEDFENNRGKIIVCGNRSVAVFRYGNSFSAVANECRHQGGPLGEERVIDGCITCPWHGYQYYPNNGTSPPPYEEKIATYDLKFEDGWVYVSYHANLPGANVEPLELEGNEQ